MDEKPLSSLKRSATFKTHSDTDTRTDAIEHPGIQYPAHELRQPKRQKVEADTACNTPIPASVAALSPTPDSPSSNVQKPAQPSTGPSSGYGQRSVLLPTGAPTQFQMRNLIRSMTGGTVSADDNLGTGAKARKKRKNLRRREKKREQEREERQVEGGGTTNTDTDTQTNTPNSVSTDGMRGADNSAIASTVSTPVVVSTSPGFASNGRENGDGGGKASDEEDEDSDKEVLNYTMQALTYLLSVKTEADVLPSFVRAPSGDAIGESNGSTQNGAGEISRYEDGAYISITTAAAAVEDRDSDPDGDYEYDEDEYWEDDNDGEWAGEEEKIEAANGGRHEGSKTSLVSPQPPARGLPGFYAALTIKFTSLHNTLKTLSQTRRSESSIEPIIRKWVSQEPTRDHSSSSSIPTFPPPLLLQVRPGTFALWKRTLLTTYPHPLQVAALSSPDTTISILKMVSQLMKRGCSVPKCLGPWIWSLLARLPDVGWMLNDQVAIVRDVGKRAAWLMVWLKEREAGIKGEKEGEGEISGVLAAEEGAGVDDDKVDTIPLLPMLDDVEGEALTRAKEMLINQVLQSTPHPHPSLTPTPTPTITTCITTGSDIVPPATSPPTLPSPDLSTAYNDDDFIDDIATLDSILHIIGTVFGQRDLLDYRYMV